MLKVMFLDMDGVINNSTLRNLVCLPMKQKDGDYTQLSNWGATNINPFLNLMKWCYDNEIEIVISSTWRLGMTKELFNEYFKKYFFRNEIPNIQGLTKVSAKPWMHRGYEIQAYVNENSVQQYICIDDDVKDIEEIIDSSKIYKVCGDVGLTDDDVSNIINKWLSNYNQEV